MKALLALTIVGTLTLLSGRVEAIPIAHVIAQPQPHRTIIGYQRVSTGKVWTWGGRKRKWVDVPIYSTALAVPEPQTYGMLLAGVALVAWRVRGRA